MNTRFHTWFQAGEAVNALTGAGSYFIPDVTFREEHDFVLAISELDQWANEGHVTEANQAFENAALTLLRNGRVRAALRLLRAYVVLRNQSGLSMNPNEVRLVESVAAAVEKDALLFTQDSEARNLLLMIINDFPALGKKVGL
jgi:hypothetical protein